MRRLGLGAVWLLVVGLACGPAQPPPAEAPSPLPEAAGLSAQHDASTLPPGRTEAAAGADPLEEESPPPAAIGRPADGSSEEGAPAASTLPSWLRAVREVQPPSVIGTGGSGPKRVGLQVGHWRNED